MAGFEKIFFLSDRNHGAFCIQIYFFDDFSNIQKKNTKANLSKTEQHITF